MPWKLGFVDGVDCEFMYSNMDSMIVMRPLVAGFGNCVNTMSLISWKRGGFSLGAILKKYVESIRKPVSGLRWPAPVSFVYI